jgi:hypothetical protein
MDNLAAIPLSLCLSKAAVAAGTTSTLSTTGTTIYSIRGKMYSTAAKTNAATPTLDFGTGKGFLPVLPGYGSVFTIGLDASGGLQAVQGSIVPLNGDGTFGIAPQFGEEQNNFCAIAYILVKAGSTSAAAGWTFGASNFAGPPTGVVFVMQDLMQKPDRPQSL